MDTCPICKKPIFCTVTVPLGTGDIEMYVHAVTLDPTEWAPQSKHDPDTFIALRGCRAEASDG